MLLEIRPPDLANLVHPNHPHQPFPADQGQREGRCHNIKGGRNWARKDPSGGQYCKRFCTKTVFEAVAEYLEARGALLRGGTIVDATLIAASPSTKNEAGKRDPQMHSSK